MAETDILEGTIASRIVSANEHRNLTIEIELHTNSIARPFRSKRLNIIARTRQQSERPSIDHSERSA